jgi:hypothetical protein
VAELEQELVTTGADTRTVNWQFTKVTNKLQKVTNEESRFWRITPSCHRM